MTKKLFLAVGSFMLASGTMAIQGCSDTGPYGYGPGYYSSRAYYSEPGYYAGNGYVGDYQAHRYWQDRDINNDARAIRQGEANIRHDKQELWEDLENHDYSAAGHEQAEIQQRRSNVRARSADINADVSAV